MESIRFLREDIHTVPNDLDIKIYIIEDAHTMTVQAQNAFLLTLEEPPPFVLFFLLTEDTDALLETVRSRAQTLRMLPLSEESIAQHLLHTAPADVISAATKLKESEPDQFAAIVKMAGGAIGVAIELLDPARREPLLERRAHVIACCRALAARNRENLARELLAIGTVREEVASILREWQLALRDLLVLSGTENAPLLFFTDRDEALTLGERFTAVRLFDIEAALSAALLSLSLNANVRLCLVQLQNSLLAAGTPQKQKGNSPFLTQ